MKCSGEERKGGIRVFEEEEDNKVVWDKEQKEMGIKTERGA